MADGDKLCVVIPTRSRPERLRECLTALQQQSFPDLEVVVVDDGGTDSLEPVVEGFPGVRLVRQAGAGPAQARNRGAQATTARFLAFLDDDCHPGPGWLQAMHAQLKAAPECAAGGRLVNGVPGNLWAETSQLIVDYLYEVWNCERDDATFLGSGHLAVAAEAFRSLGGFDPGYPGAAAEDRDFSARWRAAGRRLVYLPEVCVYHAHNLTWRGFLRQHWAYGRGARLFVRRRGGLQKPGFYLGLLSYPFRRYSLLEALRLWPALALSQVAHTAGYLS